MIPGEAGVGETHMWVKKCMFIIKSLENIIIHIFQLNFSDTARKGPCGIETTFLETDALA